MFFWQKKQERWHEVRWFSGPRDIYLAIRFADDERPAVAAAAHGAAGGAAKPRVERLSSTDAAANAAQPPLDDVQILTVIESEVAAYNRRNRFHLRVAGVRYRAKGGADVADHGSAARKLLNLL